MNKIALLSAAVLLGFAPGAFAQGTTPRPAVQINNEVTVTGCIMRESDYRKLHDEGRGGVLGSGVGVGDEFVLANAMPSSANGRGGRRGGGRGDRVEGRPVEDGGGQAPRGGGRNYTLTGPLEKNLVSDIGRMVQVVGTVDSPTAPAKPDGSIEALPRLTITVWHPVGDFCPVGK